MHAQGAVSSESERQEETHLISVEGSLYLNMELYMYIFISCKTRHMSDCFKNVPNVCVAAAHHGGGPTTMLRY